MIDDVRERLLDANGATVATFVRGMRDELISADLVEPEVGVPLDVVADAALISFPGWAFSAPPDLGHLLLARGATLLRHGHWLAYDLVADPPDPTWATLQPTDQELVVQPASLVATDYLEAIQAAYPPGHLDFEPHKDTDERIAQEIAPLFDGTLGAIHEASGTVRHRTGPASAQLTGPEPIIAACIIATKPSGPWVNDVFRRPEPTYAGLGSLLLRRSLALLSSAGESSLGLSVTEGNPARSTYDRLGFRLVREFLAVKLPG